MTARSDPKTELAEDQVVARKITKSNPVSEKRQILNVS